MRRLAVVIVLVLLAAAAAGLISRWKQQSGVSDADPATVALPEAKFVTQTQIYLAGPGAPIIKVVNIAQGLSLLEEPDPALCTQFIGQLEPLGTPEHLLQLSSEVPDPTTAEMAVQVLSATLRSLGDCFDKDQMNTSELDFAKTVLSRRLDELADS